MHPEFEDEEAINPFDLRGEGANFKIKIRKVDGYWNYDKSEFDKPAPLFDDENRLNEVFGSIHSLSGIIAPSEFKTYEELQEKLQRVLGTTGSNSTAESIAQDEGEVPWANVNTETVATEPVIESVETSAGVSADEDDAMDYFKKLAQD